MKWIVAFCLLLCGKMASSQDLSGIWRGYFMSVDDGLNKMFNFNFDDRYKFEVQLDQNGKSFKGVTYSYKTTVFYGKATAKGTINTQTDKVILEEIKTVELKMASGDYACVMTCFLQYSKNGDEEVLEGKYNSHGEKDSSACGRGTVYLHKVTTSDFHKEPFILKREEQKKKPLVSPKTNPNNPITKKPITKPPTEAKPAIIPPIKNEPKNPLVDAPSVLNDRKNELAKTIVVDTNEITINIYDNGTIDHDTVSVYLDKKLVISKQMLSTKPITFKVRMDNINNYHELVMVAENLGDIPPNTSLMIVKAGDKEYEVRITSTEQKNAVVVFKYAP